MTTTTTPGVTGATASETQPDVAGATRASRPVAAVRRRGRKPRVLANTIAVVFCLVWVFPIYWMVNTAFKPADEVTTLTPIWLPLRPTFENFTRALTQDGFLVYLRNSAIVVVAAVLLSIVVGFLASAALSRFRFRGRRAILVAMTPGITSGNSTLHRIRKVPAPSTFAASSISTGTATKNPRITQIENGSTLATYARISPT